MKIDRRSFLSFGIGTAAGIGLSPLPWKLTDDLSIWTQNWAWTPVPADGEVKYANSVCTLCSGGCGISVRKVEDRAVKIEGMNGYPGNDGKACPLGLSGLQLTYGPTAVKSPMKKKDGKWQPVSWETAISEIAEKLGKLRADNKSQSLACITDSDEGTVPELFKRFLNAYGSPNFMFTPSCKDSYEMALKLMHGTDASAGFDLENANFVVSFGSGIIEGWGTPARMFKAHSLWKDKGVKVVQIDPRLSNTAAKADQWIPVNPGTEGLLALGMAHVIIKNKLYNKDFVGKYAFGFEDWANAKGKTQKGFKSIVMDNFSPSKVSGMTGVSSNEIKKLAKAFVKASAPIALCGRGQGNKSGSIHDFLAVHALNALAGSINKKGGVCAVPKPAYVNWAAPELDGIAKKGLKTARIDGAGTKSFSYAKSLVNRLAGVINAAEESPVQALFVQGANPAYTLSGAGEVKAAFEKIPFIVCFTAYMNETAEMADIILPDLGHLEGYEDVPTPFGMTKPMIALAAPVVKTQRDAKSAGDALIQIAKKMDGTLAKSFAWASYEKCLQKTLGDKWKTLTQKGFVADASYQPAPWDKAFLTPSKKFQFMSEACQHTGKGQAVTGIDGEKTAAYPLTLISYDSMRLSSGSVADTPFLMKTIENTVLTGKDGWVEVNPKTGGKCGLGEGVYAKLITAKGAVKVKVHFNDGLMPGLIAMPTGLGRTTACDEYMSGKGLNVNDLIGNIEDPASGLDASVGVRANLLIA